MELFFDRFESPIGTMVVVFDATGQVRALDFNDYEPRMHRLLWVQNASAGEPPVLTHHLAPAEVSTRLTAYFSGEIQALDRLEVGYGGTPFQREVWRALRTIPAATTISYGELAARIGRPNASRAVGAANGANPIAIIVPCHRVIGSNGTLTGYGGGLERKRWLLAHERRAVSPSLFDAPQIFARTDGKVLL